MNGANTLALVEPTASRTAIASLAHSSFDGGDPGDPRSDCPIPLLSKRISRPIDASRRWNRAIRGSSSTQSIGVVPPVSIRMSVGPSPSTWKAISTPSTWVYLVRGVAAMARE